MYYAILGIVIIIIGYFTLHYRSGLKTSLGLISGYNDKYKQLIQENRDNQKKFNKAMGYAKISVISDSIYKCLSTIDNTHTVYIDEDEANRELTSCLNAVGRTALYHKPLDSGRTPDIFIDNHAIIEGKLEPNQSEIDRLIGQVKDYVSTTYRIFIVLYGIVSQQVLDRINQQIIAEYPSQVSLVYIRDAHRIRRQGELNGNT